MICCEAPYLVGLCLLVLFTGRLMDSMLYSSDVFLHRCVFMFSLPQGTTSTSLYGIPNSVSPCDPLAPFHHQCAIVRAIFVVPNLKIAAQPLPRPL